MPDAPVTVFDDGSTDRETCVILEDLSRKGWAKVMTPDAGPANGPAATHGGLYNNMQSFLDFHARSVWVLFLQDDTQIVRTFVTARPQSLEQISF